MDHIRDFYYHKDNSNLHEAELNLMLLSQRLENWGELVYLNKKGEVIPELLIAMLAIRQYKQANTGGNNKESQGKQWFDL